MDMLIGSSREKHGGASLNKDTKKQARKQLRQKVKIYIMSLWFLFVLIIVKTFDIPVSFAADAVFIGFKPLICRNVLPIISMLLALSGLGFAWGMYYHFNDISNPPLKVLSVKNKNYEYLTFLTTYVIPVVFVDYSNVRDVLAMVILLVLIGFILIKMDLYYGNPMLAILGYKLFEIEYKIRGETVHKLVITKNAVIKGSHVKWKEIDNNTLIVKEHK